ncbi:MAG TPA: ADOP family duplicated permease [Vicinamibacterales bacterium]|nr:ADOP family duplicated permease [Vicinamibacterales bacterium]
MRQDILFAIRQMVRQPGLSLTAVLTLGLGLGASLAVFTLVNAVLLRPLPYPESERVVAIGRGSAQNRQSVSHRDVDFLREHVRTCRPIAATVGGSGLNVSLSGTTSYQHDRLISHEFFPALGIRPQWGRGFTSEDDRGIPAPVVVLNERFVRQLDLEPASLIGRDIELGGRIHTIVGVISAAHTRPSDADIFRPLGRDSRGNGQNLTVLCRLGDDASIAALEAELAGLLEEGRRQKLVGLREAVAYSAVTQHEWEFGALRPQLNTLLFAVALVLLAAAANTTGLLLVRAAGRRREIAVRTALGAAPHRIARTLMVEGLLLAGVAGAVGLLGAPLLVRGLLAAAPNYYGELAAFDIDVIVIGAAFLLCAVVGLSVALPPLLEVLRVNLRDTLQEEGRSGTQGRRSVWMRQLLIGAETAVCAVLLVGALLLLRTFVNLMNVDPGVDTRGVITARISIQGPRYEDVTRLIRFFEEGVTRLEQLPSIESAAVGASLPGERALNLPARFPDGTDPEQIQVVNWRYVTPQYFSLLRMRLLTGRLFSEADRGGTQPVAIVNEAFAAQTYGGLEKALGRRIAIGSDREVIGVVSDTAGWTLGEPSRPMLFVPLAQVEERVVRTAHSFFPPRWIVRARDVDRARQDLAAVVREIDPSQPFIDIQSLDAMMINSVGMQRFYLVVLSAFAVFAVLLAAVGIYAAYSYAIASRTAEIGVRLALGASPARIVSGIVGRAVLAGGVATGVGLAGAAAGARVLDSLLYNVSASDPWTYVAVAVVLLGTVALATCVPALRVARIDPLAALRR